MLFKCALNKKYQLNNENIQKLFQKLFHEIKIKQTN